MTGWVVQRPGGTSDHLAGPPRTVAVVGTGMIGTSIALALRRAGVTVHLLDQDAAAVAGAAARGAGRVGAPAEPAELAVLAVPPGRIPAVLAEKQAAGLAVHYTDVGSVKATVLAQAEGLGCDLTTFVGGHPMAGGERSGPDHAAADLFRDRTWVLTPQEKTSASALSAVTDVVRLCGAHPVTMAAPDHDRIVARTSHVPHVLAAALAASVADADDLTLRLCGNGFRDTTRIAGGSVDLWLDILHGNAGDVAELLTDLAAELAAVAVALNRDPDRVAELLERGNKGRVRLTASSG